MPGNSVQNYLEQNMRYLLSLRAIAIGAQVIALLFMHFQFDLRFPLLPVTLIILGVSIYTVVSMLMTRRKGKIRALDIQVQLVVDVLALSLLVYFTGGSTNPFIFFFLLPITFAAATLNFRQACLIAGIAAISYTLLMFFHVPILGESHQQHGFNLHIWGMWYGFLISSGLLTYYVSGIGLSIRKRDRALARVREDHLKADQVLALGTLAAGTAHELGTPLATMAILAREMEYSHEDKQELVTDLKLLRQQIDRCKSILSRMALDAGQAHAGAGHPIPLDQYLRALVADWRELRPDQNTDVIIESKEPVPEIIADTILGQAIHNVLNNAANACHSRVDFYGNWDERYLNLRICDDGSGIRDQIPEAVQASESVTTGGLGIGLFLSRITVNRLGGELHLDNRPPPQSGTVATIRLPLAGICTS